MKDISLAIELLKLILSEFDKYSKNPEKCLSEISVTELLEKRATQQATAFVKSNLFYFLNVGKFAKEDVLEMCKQIPELKKYIIDRNRVYSSSTNVRFSEKDLEVLK